MEVKCYRAMQRAQRDTQGEERRREAKRDGERERRRETERDGERGWAEEKNVASE